MFGLLVPAEFPGLLLYYLKNCFRFSLHAIILFRSGAGHATLLSRMAKFIAKERRTRLY